MTGIDYGNGMTNIDHETGIRYGVIRMEEVLQTWADSSEANYGQPTCPVCESECEEYDDSNAAHGQAEQYEDRGCADYFCPTCKLALGNEDVFGEAPLNYAYNEKEYSCHQSYDDPDIFIIKSPYYTLCQFCSPCAPGAGHIMDRGDVKAYCFGHDWFESGEAPYPVYSVETGKEI